MYEEARRYREARHAKAEKMAAGTPGKPDSSDWSQAGPLDADVQTGERPISRRQFKSGGKVSGDLAQIRADRAPRSSGGWAKEYVNRDVKAANEDRAGTKHVGGFADGGNVGDTVPTSRLAFTGGESKLSKAAGLKKGGRTAKAFGGALGILPELLGGDKDKTPALIIPAGRKTGGKVDASVSGTKIVGGRTPKAGGGGAGKDAGGHGSNARANTTYDANSLASGSRVHRLANADVRHTTYDANKLGSSSRVNRIATADREMGRTPRKDGGRTKGKMNVNIIIGAPSGGQGAPPPEMPMPPPQMAGPVRPPMPMPGPVGPPPGVGAPPPMPMARKRGGRTYDAGAGSGEGRLEKVAKYGKNA